MQTPCRGEPTPGPSQEGTKTGLKTLGHLGVSVGGLWALAGWEAADESIA